MAERDKGKTAEPKNKREMPEPERDKREMPEPERDKGKTALPDWPYLDNRYHSGGATPWCIPP